MEDFRDTIPTMVITTSDNYLIRVGSPNSILADINEVNDYLIQGCTIKTITFKEYKKLNLKWYWEKSNAEQNVQVSDTTEGTS